VYWTWTGTWLQTSHGINNVGVLANNQQVCTASSYDNNVHGNGFLAPNNNPGGYALGQTWGTYSCVDHAFELGLRREPITTALEAVKAIPGYSYDHVHFEADGSALLRDKAGQLVTRPLYGFRASEVAAYLPELVENDPNGEPAYVDLDRMVVVLWEALKQHIAEEHSA
jgi:hypothetical protein